MADTHQPRNALPPFTSQDALMIGIAIYFAVAMLYGVSTFLPIILEETEQETTRRIFRVVRATIHKEKEDGEEEAVTTSSSSFSTTKRPRTKKFLRFLWATLKVVFWPLVPGLIVVDILLQEWLIPAWKSTRQYYPVAVTDNEEDLESQNSKETETETELEESWSGEKLDELHCTRVLYSSPYAPAA
ncbi:hypothetical protein B0T20DRAFT_100655 [Sordaria brevicollis]|uniref:Uncharacterized protein n=1 Tax=Sordaria brevicollis TaxID=83679 RepID=A0AAE0NVW1_SORBR|nr:hypothetical protein B0T20DRAFT_100655 [Sordaria brevicollis]